MAIQIRRTAILFFVILLAACGGKPAEQAAAPAAAPEASAAPAAGPSFAAIINGDHRSPEYRARNASRHPVETLEFFGITPEMSVVEIWPGGGWYSEILAPYLKDDGLYIAAGWDPNSEIEFIRKGVAAYQAKLDAHPDVYGNVEMAVLMYPDKMDLADADSIDMILTFRNIHNWMGRGFEGDMFTAMYRALKPGGILGVVEHRGNPAIEQDPKSKNGYVNQDYAIALAEKAGFKLVATSEINANPKDTKDHPEGVWTLPPTSRAGEDPKWTAIGESDRFTLKFVK